MLYVVVHFFFFYLLRFCTLSSGVNECNLSDFDFNINVFFIVNTSLSHFEMCGI